MTNESYASLCSLLNLRRAWERVEESDGCAGIDGVTLERFEDHLEAELTRLRGELVSESYAPLPLLQFTVPKAGGGQRKLAVPSVRDRVAQLATKAIIEPAFEAEFEQCSFAYRRSRSVQQALNQVEQLREAGYEWVVDADITSYFDNVDHQLLLKSVSDLVADPRIVRLITQWIVAMVYDGQQMTKLEKGLPQGAPISPMLANLFLDRFDELMLRDGQRLVRYADDFLILCRSRPRAEEALQLTGQILGELRLALNLEKTRVTSFSDGFRFLGATFIRSLSLMTDPQDKGPAERAIRLPPPLPILRHSGKQPTMFNPALRDGLRQALLNPEDPAVPAFYKMSRAVSSADTSIAALQRSVVEVECSQEGETEMSGSVPDQSTELTLSSDDVPAESGSKGMPSLVTLRTLYLQDHGVVLRCEDDHLRVTLREMSCSICPHSRSTRSL